ncbi:hypothetical protein [Ammoniphilus sp. 3BR4]
MKHYRKRFIVKKGLAILGNILFIAGFLAMVLYFLTLVPQLIVP